MSLSILLVDDETDSCYTLGRMLAKRGFLVDLAGEGQEALELVKKRDYALVIMDFKMPVMNGVQLFRAIRELRPEMRGMFLTGYPTINVVYPAIREGILRVLAKPVDFEELNAVIDELVGAPVVMLAK